MYFGKTHLPRELLDLICSYLDLPDLKECRLLSPEFESAATAQIFETVHLSFTEPCILRFESIGNSERLAPWVRNIILRQGPQRGYPAFSSYASWRYACKNSYGYTTTSEKWANMTYSEREGLYDKYENDRAMLRYDKDYFLEKVVRSLKKMTNVSSFWHEPTNYDEMDWKQEWGGLQFYQEDDDIDSESWAYSEEVEHDIDSLHTALFLQALGSVQPSELKTISFEIYGPGFWTPMRLRHLWEGYGHGKIRRLREEYADAVIADQKADEGIDNMAIEDYSSQLHTLQSIISHIESIDLNVVESYSNRSLDTIAEPLSRFLRLGKNLRNVTLAYGNFHPYFDTRGESYKDFSDFRKKKQDLLAQLATGSPWPVIATLHITIATDSSSLLGFLEAISPTLRTLWLDSVILLPGDRERETWEYVLPGIPARLPKIEHLLLDDLKDFGADGSTRKILCSSDWKCRDCHAEFAETIVTDLLASGELRHKLGANALSKCEH